MHKKIAGAEAWFKNYFSDRKQFVCIDSQASEELIVTSGVPQGSFIGTLLFIVYTSNNQRLGSAGEDDAFLAIWVMKDLGAHREKGFVLRG